MKAKATFCSYTSQLAIGQDNSKKLNTEMAEMRTELEKTRSMLRQQRVRYQQLVSLFHKRLQEKEEEKRAELQVKHHQLTRILRSLYILESKLRKEQRTLKTTFTEHDDLVKSQELEINKLKSELQRLSTKCACSVASNTFSQDDNNKPDLISSIGIEMLKSDETPLSSPQSEADPAAYVVTSLDDYDSSWATLHVQDTKVVHTIQTVNNINMDDELRSERHKFKMKDDQTFDNHSPSMILKEVTEKLNGPVLNCVKQILSQGKSEDGMKIEPPVRIYPTKAPKPVLKRDSSKSETDVPKVFLVTKEDTKIITNQNGIQDESSIVRTVSAVLSDSAESEDEEQGKKSPPTVSQMVKKFEELKSKKKQESVGVSQKSDSTAIQTNFEEFHLIDKEIEFTCEDVAGKKVIRLEAEGEERLKTPSIVEVSGESVNSTEAVLGNSNDNERYEMFLEVTGLSQKSILTPSRILSNHRNVIKPKDVKYRSRVKAAAGLADKCSSNAASDTSPTMKYWVEPYL